MKQPARLAHSMGMKLVILAAIFLVVCSAHSATSPPATRPVELGRIEWLRDFDAAQQQAKKANKPMLVLFDEVPGCMTCKQFGSGPLSHPLVVDAAGLFVPVAVYNNAKGPDAVVLKQFKEPAWNNPVVRFLDADGRDLIPRKDGVWSAPALVSRMIAALEAAKIDIPPYLRLANAELSPSRKESAVFAAGCYWEGEKHLGSLDGVIGTRIGMLDGHEVVEVDFDAAVLDFPKLVTQAKSLRCATRVYARTAQQVDPAKAVFGNAVARSDAKVDTGTQQQYHLAHMPEYHYLPLTALQATKVNSAIAARKSPDEFLSPGQLALRDRLVTLKADRKAVDALRKLNPDRTTNGLAAYARALDQAIAELGK